jgi:hypothetical protein
MNLKEFSESAISDISNSENKAETFVKWRIDLHNKFSRGRCFSTSHGADIFNNILSCLDGGEWKEDGDLGYNFKKLIKDNLK